MQKYLVLILTAVLFLNFSSISSWCEEIPDEISGSDDFGSSEEQLEDILIENIDIPDEVIPTEDYPDSIDSAEEENYDEIVEESDEYELPYGSMDEEIGDEEPEIEESDNELGLVSVRANAENSSDIVDSGNCGESMNWYLQYKESRLCLSIDGSGTMSFDGDDAPWSEYRESIEEVTLADGITSIAEGAFSEHHLLSNIVLPNGLKTIGGAAFWESGLRSIHVPSSVTTIDYEAFKFSPLDSVNGMEGVEFIGSEAFSRTNICEITLPCVKRVEAGAFCDCYSLFELVLPDTLEYIGSDVFMHDDNLKSVTFLGDAPITNTNGYGGVFSHTDLTAYYPAGNATWTSDVKKQFSVGGNVEWKEEETEEAYFIYDKEHDGMIGEKIQLSVIYVSTKMPASISIDAKGTEKWTASKTHVEENKDSSYGKSWILTTDITFKETGLFDVDLVVEGDVVKFVCNVSKASSSETISGTSSSAAIELLAASGTFNTIRYLRKNSNFPCSTYVAQNDENFAFRVAEALSNMLYRNLDGWKEIFAQSTSKEEARNILLALLDIYDADIQELSSASSAHKYAGLFVNTLKEANWAYAIDYGLSSKEIQDLSAICTENKIADFFVEGKYDSISAYLQVKGSYSENSNVIQCIEKYSQSEKLANSLSRGLRDLGTGLTIINMTQQTIQKVYEIDRLGTVDEVYSEMLLYLSEHCPYSPVQDAAGELYSVINDGYLAQISYAAEGLSDALDDKMTDIILSEVVKKIPYGELIKTTFDYSIGIANAVFNIADFQKQMHNVRCASYIGASLSNWLGEKYSEFLARNNGKDGSEEEYARKAVFAYYILANIRLMGEKSFQKCLELSFVDRKCKSWTISCDIVQNLKLYIDQIKGSGILDEYVSSVIACPVDVEVYNSDGSIIKTLYDGIEENGIVENIYYSTVYHPIDKEYIKIITMPKNQGCYFKCNSNGIGIVDCSFMSFSDDGDMIYKETPSIPVYEGQAIDIYEADAEMPQCVLIDDKAEREYPVFIRQDYIPVKSIQCAVDSIDLFLNEKVIIDAKVSPLDATEGVLNWKSDNENVVSVNSEGVITGNDIGGANIIISSVEEETINITIPVTVKRSESENWEKEPNDGKERATVIFPGATYNGIISSISDRDYYKFDVDRDGAFLIKLSRKTDTGSHIFNLDDCSVLLTFDEGDKEYTLSEVYLQKGTHYVLIRSDGTYGGEPNFEQYSLLFQPTIHHHKCHREFGYPATTKAPGLTDGEKCYECGKWVVKQKVIPKIIQKDGKLSKKRQPMTVKAKKSVVKKSKLKKKKQVIKKNKAFIIKNAQGKLKFKKISGSKKLSISKNGNITVKKKTKKGTYKMKVRVTASGNARYKSGSKTIIVKVKVK